VKEFAMHPLWDPDGYFRRALFRDDEDGSNSLRRFFFTRARHAMLEHWAFQGARPEHPENWGYGEEMDALIHEYLTKAYSGAAPEEQPVREPVAAFGELGVFPHAAAGRFAKGLLLDLETEAPYPSCRVYDAVDQNFSFTRLGMPLGGISVFEVGARHPVPGRRCLAFLLSPDAVEFIKEKIGAVREPDEDALALAFASETLRSGHSDHLAERRAFDIGSRLALAPSLEGVSDSSDGWFRKGIDNLPTGAFSLDKGSWVIVCFGPSTSATEAT
jgi:hypothetical protein